MKFLYLTMFIILTATVCNASLTWEEKKVIYHKRCIKKGFKPGTQDYMTCIAKQYECKNKVSSQQRWQENREALQHERFIPQREGDLSNQRLKRELKFPY